ncbi:MAG: GerMN domain-containing protein [Bacilli bacterium]|nr:GerMN domain-containing protein [Bacilli bacterium]
MLKECAKKKLMITGITFFIFLFTMFCPTIEKPISSSFSIPEGKLTPIYLLNRSSYVSRTEMMLKSEQILPLAKEIVSILTIDSKDTIYIPSIFSPVLPAKTKLLSVDLQDTTLKLNFDKTFLSVPPSKFLKMLECLIYSITEINGVENVLIYVEGELLRKDPHTSQMLSLPFSREMGVNTLYSLDKLSDSMKTTAYYLAKEDYYTYYIPVTFVQNENKEKVEVIIEELKSRPHLNTNLISYLHANAELENYELLEQEVKLSFNDSFYEGLFSEEMIEEVKYSIALSMKDSLNVKEVTFLT